MRASKFAVAVASCLVASVMGTASFIDSGDFKRELHKGDGNDHQQLRHANSGEETWPVEYPDFTIEFNNADDTVGPDRRTEGWEMSETSMIGLAVGFISTWVFILFALVNIIWDEAKRHSEFTADVNKGLETLSAEPFNYDEPKIQALLEEFNVRDAQDEQAALEAERKELAEIN